MHEKLTLLPLASNSISYAWYLSPPNCSLETLLCKYPELANDVSTGSVRAVRGFTA